MSQVDESKPVRRYSPLKQLVFARQKEPYREPEAVFWVYGFPILMVVALGIAFRNKPIERITVDVQEVTSPSQRLDEKAVEDLKKNEKFVASIFDESTCRMRLRTGKTDLVVIATAASQPPGVGYQYLFDPTRPESVLARNAVDDALQNAAGRKNPVATTDQEFEELGGRYIDFLVPGLLGMSLMGGGLWGLGFVIVDMRIRKLLKRFLATPMKKSHFLGGLMLSRLLFMIPEVLILLAFSHFVFGVKNQGSWLAVLALILLGAFTFAGLGLMIASRAKTLEAVSGLMNLVMLPMWVLSGIFFSSERFPEAAQPFIKAIPLTPLNNALRAVMLDGASLASQLPEMGILAGWAVASFFVALKLFRWK